MKRFYFILILISTTAMAQNSELPYYEIPDAPAEYTASTVTARMIDGLGFRFYWATEGLRPEDLSYKPSEDARSSGETIAHIHSMSFMVLNAVLGKENSGTAEKDFAEMRAETLNNLKTASDILRAGRSLEDSPAVFRRGDNTTEYPFWNLINGPIEDMVWHVGQVITFRRSSGNPYNNKASLFNGKVRK